MRADALALFRDGVDAANPVLAVRRALDARRDRIARAKRVVLVAFGKAAVSMAEAALPFAQGKLTQAIALTNHENVRDLAGVTVIGAGHPVPDENGTRGAALIERAVDSAEPGDLVLVLVSGGGSALLCAPAPGLTLQDKIALNEALLKCGADIAEINKVRPIVSRLKGGGLARRARKAAMLALILSDVPGDDLPTIASGPTVPRQTSAEEALRVLEKYDLMNKIPAAVSAHVRGALGKPYDATLGDVENVLIGSNRVSLGVVMDRARARYENVVLGREWLHGDVANAAAELHGMARTAAASGRPTAVVCGGETTVIVKGSGKGGRNQELALRFALLNEKAPLGRPWVFLSGGTDGRDGPCDAAGGIVDSETLSRMRGKGIDPAARLADNDSYPALAASGDLIMIGGTGTNVADIQVILVG